MLFTLWSVKGGSGTSVVAAGLASVLARDGRDVLLVDLAGDQPALLGTSDPAGPGIGDWLATSDGDAAALGRLEIAVGDGFDLLPAGRIGSVDADRARDLADVLASDERTVVVDAGGPGSVPSGRGSVGGSAPAGDPPPSALRPVLCGAGASILVVRACYLALRRAVRAGVSADRVVLVVEPGRALDGTDVSRALGLPVLDISWDPAVARTVDAGLMSSRLPRGFVRELDALTDLAAEAER